MSRRRKRAAALRQQPSMTAIEALELAETMSSGEAAQMGIAAELMGLDYGDFLDALARESGATEAGEGSK